MRNFTSILIVLITINFRFGQGKSCACCTEKHSEFDFWIGNWEVTGPNGKKVGDNILAKVEDNCVLQENLTSATPGYTGTSNSFYLSIVLLYYLVQVKYFGIIKKLCLLQH